MKNGRYGWRGRGRSAAGIALCVVVALVPATPGIAFPIRATPPAQSPAASGPAGDIRDLLTLIQGKEPPRQQQQEPTYDEDSESTAINFGFVSDRATEYLVATIRAAVTTCSFDDLRRRYRIDCLRYFFWKAAQELPARGEYLPVKRVLAKAEADLERILRRDIDRQAERIRPRLGGKPDAPRLPRLRAVKAETEARARREAQAVVAEATTVLLRSSENSDRRKVHFQQIAQAVDSTKVLLRSA